MPFNFQLICFQVEKVQKIWSNVFVKTTLLKELDVKKEGLPIYKNTSKISVMIDDRYWYNDLSTNSNHLIPYSNAFNVYFVIGGLMDLTGKDCNNEHLLLQSFQGLLDILTRLTLTIIQKITKHHHLTMSVVGMSIGRKLFVIEEPNCVFIFNDYLFRLRKLQISNFKEVKIID